MLKHTTDVYLIVQVDVIIRGYSGYNTRWALHLLPDVFPPTATSEASPYSAYPPAVVTVSFGANDAALPDRTSGKQHVPIPEYKRNLQAIVDHLLVSQMGGTVPHGTATVKGGSVLKCRYHNRIRPTLCLMRHLMWLLEPGTCNVPHNGVRSRWRVKGTRQLCLLPARHCLLTPLGSLWWLSTGYSSPSVGCHSWVTERGRSGDFPLERDACGCCSWTLPLLPHTSAQELRWNKRARRSI